jgi:hypothetical protein
MIKALMVGDKVRLNAQLSDNESSMPKKVKAAIRDATGTVLARLELTHVGEGLFKNSDYIMTDTPEITAQYNVYNQDDTLDRNYSSELDVFTLINATSLGGLSQSGAVDSEYIVLYHNEKD